MRPLVASVIARLRTDALIGTIFDTAPGAFGQAAAPRIDSSKIGKHVIVRPAYDSIRYERIAGGRSAAIAYLQLVHVAWHPDEVAAIRRRVSKLLDDWSPLPGATGMRESQAILGEDRDVTPSVPYAISEYRVELPGETR